MDFQFAFNIAVALVGALGGYVLRSISARLESLQRADTDLTDKVQKIEVLVVGEYVRHSDLEKIANALFAKLDRISDKLDSKEDKK
jgi:CHASE3 domain sensor protein